MMKAADIPSSEPSTAPTAKRPLYEASTQFRNWRYSPEQLSDTRASLNAAAIAGIRQTLDAVEVRFLGLNHCRS